ncbi:Hypothetical protein, putative [Bodo saltans]|uniref:Uncharacterized protein n=1 Tax=Bodo saltans TaxID=75058 RepID=A0A0S4KIT8_BODSA|nr:Hypothetical protein, putative [Bodo saltans]|eukprot:CUI14297.1 Hypothetical protein, putative [Bodo saltans]
MASIFTKQSFSSHPVPSSGLARRSEQLADDHGDTATTTDGLMHSSEHLLSYPLPSAQPSTAAAADSLEDVIGYLRRSSVATMMQRIVEHMMHGHSSVVAHAAPSSHPLFAAAAASECSPTAAAPATSSSVRTGEDLLIIFQRGLELMRHFDILTSTASSSLSLSYSLNQLMVDIVAWCKAVNNHPTSVSNPPPCARRALHHLSCISVQLRPLCIQLCCSCEHAMTVLQRLTVVMPPACECRQQQQEQQSHLLQPAASSTFSVIEAHYRTLLIDAIAQAINDHFEESSVLFLKVAVPRRRLFSDVGGNAAAHLCRCTVITGAGMDYNVSTRRERRRESATFKGNSLFTHGDSFPSPPKQHPLVLTDDDNCVDVFVVDISEWERIPFELDAMRRIGSGDAVGETFAGVVGSRLANIIAIQRTSAKLQCAGLLHRSRL